uniref:Putative secreted protein n=1 Tax=Anopheles marajoara TaxID=58244 RepID=A0A2M4CCI0_9DIPT
MFRVFGAISMGIPLLVTGLNAKVSQASGCPLTHQPSSRSSCGLQVQHSRTAAGFNANAKTVRRRRRRHVAIRSNSP